LRDIVVANPAPDPWPVRLQRGFFKVICGDGRQQLFEVTGAAVGGIAGEFDVHL
jgi:hypothetical protein